MFPPDVAGHGDTLAELGLPFTAALKVTGLGLMVKPERVAAIHREGHGNHGLLIAGGVTDDRLAGIRALRQGCATAGQLQGEADPTPSTLKEVPASLPLAEPSSQLLPVLGRLTL